MSFFHHIIKMLHLMMSKKKNPLFRGGNRKFCLSGFTVCHHSACLVMLNVDPGDRFFYPTLMISSDSVLSSFAIISLERERNCSTYSINKPMRIKS